MEAGVRPKRMTTKVSHKLCEKLFHCLYWKRGGCYSGQALVCAIPVAHIAFVVHESVVQYSDNSVQQLSLHLASKEWLGGCGVCSELHALHVTHPIIVFQLFI